MTSNYPTEFWLSVIRDSSSEWLLEQVKWGRKFVHDAKQLLRSPESDSSDPIREAIRMQEEDIRLMSEELDRRKTP